MAEFLIIENFLSAASERDLTGIQNDRTVGEFESGNGVLLDNNRGNSSLFDFLKDLFDFMNDGWSKALVGLIQKQQFNLTG